MPPPNRPSPRLGHAVIFRSPYSDVAAPTVPFHELIFRRAEQREHVSALIDPDSERTITYGELVRDARRVACGLAALGMSKGEVFALMLPNVPEFAIAFFGVLAAGGVVTTINPLYTADEVAHQLRDSGAKYLLTVPQCLEQAAKARTHAPLREVFTVKEAPGATCFHELLASSGEPRTLQFDVDNDLTVIPYSSGTTGKPKGVALTHTNLSVSVLAAVKAAPMYGEGVVGLGLLPFFHIAGMVMVLHVALYDGGTLALMCRFELERMLQIIQRYRIGVASLVPPIILALAKHPAVNNYDLSSLKLVTSGAAPLGADIEQACQQRLRTPVIQGCGMTEASGLTHGGLETIGRKKPGTVGPCLPNIECKLIDPMSGRELGPNERGELWLRGPQVMKGYLNNPEATAQCLDRDGWLHTGDIAYADEDGYFFIVDRVKELIKYKGFQVAPAELEAILVTHPAIAEAAVIPSPDDEAGEVPKAFLVAKHPVAIDEVLDYVASRVAPYKKIRRAEFIDQLPKSPAGKLLRRVLRERDLQKVKDSQG